MRLQEEIDFSRHNFDAADVSLQHRLFELYANEAQQLLAQDLVLPAYDYTLRCSHTFNVLEARGAISVTERTGFIQKVRKLALACARQYLERDASRRAAGTPPAGAAGSP